MDELFSFSTQQQLDFRQLHQNCLPYEDEEDSFRESKKRSRTRPGGKYDLDDITVVAVDKRKRLAQETKRNKRERFLLDEEGEDEDLHTDSSDISSSDDETEELQVLSSTSSSPHSVHVTPPQPLMDDDCRLLLQEARRAISDFSSSPIDGLDSTFERPCQSPVLVVEDSEFTLRVRCQGKVHQCSTRKEDPLSLVARKLSDTLKVKVDRILLQWKTTDLNITDTPAKLGISAVDILDAYVMDESTALPEVLSVNDITDGDTMTIKIQTTKKCSKYKLRKGEKLERAMLTFAAELGLRFEQLKFTFDGETISRNQTAEDLDMVDDDIIDATRI